VHQNDAIKNVVQNLQNKIPGSHKFLTMQAFQRIWFTLNFLYIDLIPFTTAREIRESTFNFSQTFGFDGRLKAKY
jgi:hypothetical protein